MNADVIGYRVVTRNTTYLLTAEEGGRFMICAITPPKDFGSLSQFFSKPIACRPREYPPEVGFHFIFSKAGDDWPKVRECESPISTSPVLEVWPVTDDDLEELRRARSG